MAPADLMAVSSTLSAGFANNPYAAVGARRFRHTYGQLDVINLLSCDI